VLSYTNLYGTAITEPDGAITFTESLNLGAGDQYFWLVYDVDTTANEGNILDATWVSYQLNGDVYAPAESNPAGARTILERSSGYNRPLLELPPVSAAEYQRNWIDVKIYDGNDSVFSQQRTYSDGIGRTTQVQSLAGSQVTVSQVVFDHFGRPALQSLPATLDENEVSISYRTDFIQSAPGTNYSYTNFEGAKRLNPDPLYQNTVNSLGWYYSDHNTIEAYVAADKYPFVRTLFSADPFARPVMSTLAGQDHKAGSGHENKMVMVNGTPEMAYIYGYYGSYIKEENEELQRGIPQLMQLLKTVSVNPDGKVSVVYSNQSGQTVASCVSGSPLQSACRKQLVQLALEAGGTRSADIHIPRNTITSLKFVKPEWMLLTDTYPYTHITYTMVDLLNNTKLVEGTHYSVSSAGAVTFLGAYAGRDGFFRISCRVAPGVSTTYVRYNGTDRSPKLEYMLDYTDWSLNYYDLRGNVVQTVSPEGVNCNFNPLSSAHQNAEDIKINMTLNPLSQVDDMYMQSIEVTPSSMGRFVQIDLGVYGPGAAPYVSGTSPLREPDLDLSLHAVSEEGGFFQREEQPVLNGEYKDWKVFRYDFDIIATDTNNNEVVLNSNPLYIYMGLLKKANDNIDYYPYRNTLSQQFDNAILQGYKRIRIALTHVDVYIEDVGYLYENIRTGMLHNIYLDPVRVNPAYFLPYDQNDASHAWGMANIDYYRRHIFKKFSRNGAVNTGNVISYAYDGLNQLIRKTTPDAGTIQYVYDLDGKLRFSQNARQLAENKFSYTNYDRTGRVTEVGEYDPSVAHSEGISPYFFETQAHFDSLGNPSPGPTSPKSVILILEQNYGPDAERSSQQTWYAYDLKSSDFPVSLSTNYKQGGFLNGRLAKSWNANNASWYSYDEQGRMRWDVQAVSGLATNKTLDYTYNFFGGVIDVIYQKYNRGESFHHHYVYDRHNRLSEVSTSTSTTTQVQATYEYYAHGPLKRTLLGNDYQGLDYVYTINGWLKSINSPEPSRANDPGKDGGMGARAAEAADIFGMSLDYFSGDYERKQTQVQHTIYNAADPVSMSYAGEVRAMRWSTNLPSGAPVNPAYTGKELIYTYQYDFMSRISGGVFGTTTLGSANNTTYGRTDSSTTRMTMTSLPEYRLSGISYDRNGNISSLTRKGALNGGSYNMDQLSYAYSNNTLNSVSDAIGSGVQADDFESSAYTYDASGQMKTDNTKNLKIEYDVYGKVVKLYDKTSNVLRVQYDYNERGQKIRKTTYSGSTPVVQTQVYYISDVSGHTMAVYESMNVPLNGYTNTLSEYPVYGAGRIGVYRKPTSKYEYEIADHLGNVRATFTWTSNAIEVLSYSDYYPHGGVLPARHYLSSNAYRYGYQGQEKEAEGNWSNFELRMYDADLGRWLAPDPMGQHFSPYLAMSNNPVSYIDPSGGEDKYDISVDPSNISLSAKYSNYDDAFKELTWKIVMGELRQATVDRIYELGTKYYDREIEKWIYNAQGYEIHLRSVDNRSLRRSYYTDGTEYEDGKVIHSSDMPKMGSKEWFESASGRVEQDYTIESFTIPIFGFLKNFKLASKGVEEAAQVVSGQAAKTGAQEMITVGRWMSKGEYEAMKNGTTILEGAGGQTFVTQGGSHLFNGAVKGSVYAEFQVPANSLLQGGKQGWLKMLGPDASKSQQYLLQKQGGSLLPQYQNLSPILKTK
jgi:RHS repeat-associated protein